MTRYQIGQLGERKATELLRLMGYKVKPVPNQTEMFDLIAEKRNEVLGINVKYSEVLNPHTIHPTNLMRMAFAFYENPERPSILFLSPEYALCFELTEVFKCPKYRLIRTGLPRGQINTSWNEEYKTN